MKPIETIQFEVKKYYGKELHSSSDLKTGACCTSDSLPPYLKEIYHEIDTEVTSKYYGCGSPIPEALSGTTVLDLGSGTGQDVFMVAKLVGSHGMTIGVDMTEEQIDVAKKHQDSQMKKFDLDPNLVEFKLGTIEDLKAIGIKDNAVDIVISNCVLNLSHDKEKVFQEILRVLKPGGELYFSDIYSDRRVSSKLQEDPVLYGECLSGALYTEDFRRLLHRNHIYDYRQVKSSQVPLIDSEIKSKLDHIRFTSITYRIFNLELEDKCEDYGQVVKYRGGIPFHEKMFHLDDHHTFEIGKWESVCGNTFDMLSKSRFSIYFEFMGDNETHYGIYGDCDTSHSKNNTASQNSCC